MAGHGGSVDFVLLLQASFTDFKLGRTGTGVQETPGVATADGGEDAGELGGLWQSEERMKALLGPG